MLEAELLQEHTTHTLLLQKSLKLSLMNIFLDVRPNILLLGNSNRIKRRNAGF
ncbi:hypothetical protein ALC56_10836 [Trachymyrmex septentrionalis]|uniref:Uncharacterized protein n=1 Tax=Trachymyrmex septentrionalis TaxID=34720 RepID=A0A195F329_9HYME|nr:hypothetical protein ALC56_10836 [Trachymyrmex septentrionalis]